MLILVNVDVFPPNHTMTDFTQGPNVTSCLQQDLLNVSSYIYHMLRTKGMGVEIHLSLSELTAGIFRDLYDFLPALPAILPWAIPATKKIFQMEVREHS